MQVPGQAALLAAAALESSSSASLVVSGAPSSAPAQHELAALPISQHTREICTAVGAHGVVLVRAAAGSGKTTGLPPMLADAGWCTRGHMIAVVLPHALPTLAAAVRVAALTGRQLGEAIGFATAHSSAWSASTTHIKFMSCDMLLRELYADPLLHRYSVVLLDEVHERTTEQDLLAGLLRRVRRQRPELRLVLLSATLDACSLAQYFDAIDDAPVSTAPADGVPAAGKKRSRWDQMSEAVRTALPALLPLTPRPAVLDFPERGHTVSVHHAERPARDYCAAAVDAVLDIHARFPPGGILVFLPTVADIRECEAALQERALLPSWAAADGPSDASRAVRGHGGAALDIVRLHAHMPANAQLHAVRPGRTRDSRGQPVRRVVLSDAVAQCSVTLPGVSFVVDCGLTQLQIYNPATGLHAPAVVAASQAAIAQRAGRAGRTSPGHVFRLYPAAAVATLPATTAPEIARSDLCEPLLRLLTLGVRQPAKFEFISPPSHRALARAAESLCLLGALRSSGAPSPVLAHALARLPLHPRLGAALLAGLLNGAAQPMLAAAAMLQLDPSWKAQHRGGSKPGIGVAEHAVVQGDVLTYINVLTSFQATPEPQRKSWATARGFSANALFRALALRAQFSRALKSVIRSAAEHDRAAMHDGNGHAAATVSGGWIQLREVTWADIASADIHSVCDDVSVVTRCISAAYFEHAATLASDGRYRSVLDGRLLALHPTSVCSLYGSPPAWIVYQRADLQDQEYAVDVTVINPKWLLELAPAAFQAPSQAAAQAAEEQAVAASSAKHAMALSKQANLLERYGSVAGAPGTTASVAQHAAVREAAPSSTVRIIDEDGDW